MLEPDPEPGVLSRMPFDHEKLDVYGLAVDFVVRANEIVETLPRGRGYLADQLQRAALSAAVPDVCARLGLLGAEQHGAGKEALERIGMMLTRLIHVQKTR